MLKRLTIGLLALFILMVTFSVPSHANEMESLIKEMISIYTMSSKGHQDPQFLAKVNEIDEQMRQQLEKDRDIEPFKQLLKSAEEMKARKSARKMFEVVLERAFKRLQFTRVQQDVTGNADLLEEIELMIGNIERYLDPSLPDLDTVDRQSLDQQRDKLQKKIKKAYASLSKLPEDKRISVEVMREDGTAGKISAGREANLLAKLKSVIPEPGKMSVKIKLDADDLFDMEIFVQSFIAPNGFSVIEGELGFKGIALKSLDNSDASHLEDVLGNSFFNRYRIVQDEEQLNIMPKVGQASYEMGSFAPGQTWKMPLTKIDNVTEIIRSLEGNTEIAVVNAKHAANEKAIEFKNNGERNLIFLQGTDMTGLVSVKALGFLVPRKGQVTFREVLMIVDDALSSDVTSYIGGQGINWFLKRASDNLRKGLPFTPILENLNMDRDSSGKMVYIFSGRGPVAR